MSPPWGGPEYIKEDTYSMEMLKPWNAKQAVSFAKTIASKVILFLPRNTDLQEIVDLCDDTDVIDVEANMLNGKFKTLTVYISPGHSE